MKQADWDSVSDHIQYLMKNSKGQNHNFTFSVFEGMSKEEVLNEFWTKGYHVSGVGLSYFTITL